MWRVVLAEFRPERKLILTRPCPLQLRWPKQRYQRMADQEFREDLGWFRLHRVDHGAVASQQWGLIQPTVKELLTSSLFLQQPDVLVLMLGQRRRWVIQPCQADAIFHHGQYRWAQCGRCCGSPRVRHEQRSHNSRHVQLIGHQK